MKRAGVIVAILILGVFVAGTWLVAGLPKAPILVAGATDIQVVRLGLWEQQISYYVPGRPYGWYWGVTRQLDAQQWKVNKGWHPELAPPNYNPLIPLTFERIVLGFIVEEVILDPDTRHPNVAHIRITRRIAITWWRVRRNWHTSDWVIEATWLLETPIVNPGAIGSLL